MSDLKGLTRKSLESSYENMEKRLMAENMKCAQIKVRLRSLIPLIANEVKGQAKRQVNGKIRALIAWLDESAQFQFIEELDKKGPVKLVTFNNIWIGLLCFIVGVSAGTCVALIVAVGK